MLRGAVPRLGRVPRILYCSRIPEVPPGYESLPVLGYKRPLSSLDGRKHVAKPGRAKAVDFRGGDTRRHATARGGTTRGGTTRGGTHQPVPARIRWSFRLRPTALPLAHRGIPMGRRVAHAPIRTHARLASRSGGRQGPGDARANLSRHRWRRRPDRQAGPWAAADWHIPSTTIAKARTT